MGTADYGNEGYKASGKMASAVLEEQPANAGCTLQSGKVFKNAGLFGPRVKILKNDLLNKKFRRHGQGLKFLSKAKPTNPPT